MLPEPKILLRDPVMGPCNLTKFKINTTLLTSSKVAVTELGAEALATNKNTTLIFFGTFLESIVLL